MHTIRCLILIALCFMTFDIAAAQQPATVVAVQLRSPDLTVMALKYRVFWNRAEVKKIPLLDYDFSRQAIKRQGRQNPCRGSETLGLAAYWEKISNHSFFCRR